MSFHSKLTEKVVSVGEIEKFVNVLRIYGKKIVFTNGCFDILHLGHVDYLNQARDSGDALIIGLNTDSSVKRQNKGENRPVNNEESRAKLLAALSCVDAVVLFEDETPYELIKLIQPDVLVKGDDYKAEDIVGYDIVKKRGGEVITIPLVKGYSTTSLINKIKS
ncbi:MAG: D-glycero-beta-D-manno-heptose 1-phosphate adenylyltransferase [Bacteroidia bacterium]